MNQQDEPADAGGEHVLIAADDSAGAHRALRYLGHMIAGRPGFRVLVYHRLPALPPQLREHGGSSDPERETELGRDLSRRIAQWVSSLEQQLQPSLQRARKELIDSGAPAAAIELMLDKDVFPGETLCDALLRVARAHACHTIVVAREHVRAIEGIDELLRRHTGDALVRTGEGFAVWVIE